MKFEKKILSAALVAALAFGLSGCGSDSSDDTTSEETEVHFGYFGANGPSHWGDLKPEWSTCKNGLTLSDVTDPTQHHQSPINFTSAAVASEPSFELDVDRDIEFTTENNGHAIEMVPESSEDTMVLDGKTYTLAQFHFHAYSEHTQNNMPAAIETHFVFKAADGSLAVLGVFVDRNATNENSALASIFSQTLPEAGEEGAKLSINVADILPEASSVYSYSGSLTTPPCSEGVAWNVYTKHINLSESHVVNFTKKYHNNFRPVTGNW